MTSTSNVLINTKPLRIYLANMTQVFVPANLFEINPIGVVVTTPSGICLYPWSNIWKAEQ